MTVTSWTVTVVHRYCEPCTLSARQQTTQLNKALKLLKPLLASGEITDDGYVVTLTLTDEEPGASHHARAVVHDAVAQTTLPPVDVSMVSVSSPFS